MNEQNGEYVCPHCADAFATYQARNAHKGLVHDARVEVECKICGEVECVTPTTAESYTTCSYECAGILTSQTRTGSDNPNYASGASTERMKELYQEGLSSPEIAERMPVTSYCVRERLKKAGVEIEDPGFPKKVETDAGYSVRSYYERLVAEWLDRHDVDHEYEPNGFGKWTPDFVVQGDVIEVWGVKNDKEYNERRQTKEMWYEDHGIVCVGIEPHDIDNLDKILEEYT